MLEVIGAIRDVFIILAAIIMTVMTVIVGRAILSLTRKAEDLRSFAITAVNTVINPLQGLQRMLTRRHSGR